MSANLRVAVVAADPGVAEVAGLFLQQIECELVLAQVVGEGTLTDSAVAVVCVASLDQARQFIPPTRAALADPPTVIAFGRGVEPAEALALGALAFVPADSRPIDLCVVVALAATSAFGDLRITGSADDYGGVLPLVRALSVARRTGKLDVASGEHHGHVNLFDGQLVSVVADGVKGEPAFHQILRWDSPKFNFADRAKPFVTHEVFVRAEALVGEVAEAAPVRTPAAGAHPGDITQPGMTVPDPVPPDPDPVAPKHRAQTPAPRPPDPVEVPAKPRAREPEPVEIHEGMGGVLLYVDNSKTMQTCAEITFRATEMIYVGARDPAQALTLARQYQPAIILADADLEGMSGYDLCTAVKHDPQLADVPVLLVHGVTRSLDKERVESVGAVGFIDKPWDTTVIIERVRQVLAGGGGVGAGGDSKGGAIGATRRTQRGVGAAGKRSPTPPMGSPTAVRARAATPAPVRPDVVLGEPPPLPAAPTPQARPLPPPPRAPGSPGGSSAFGGPPRPGAPPQSSPLDYATRAAPEPHYRFPPSPVSPEPIPTGHDRVDCTVFAPKACAADTPFMVQVFAHLPASAAVAAAMASEFDEDAVRRGTTNLQADLPRGAHLTFELRIRGAEVFDPVESMRWVGNTDSVQFEVVAHGDAPVLFGRLLVSMGGVPIGTIRFKIAVDERMARVAADSEPTGDAHRYRYAFISYASEDRAEVMRRVQMLASLRIDFFQDVLDLDPGARWEAELYRNIDRADVFFLFWSGAAARSSWVLREVRYAVARKSGNDDHPPDILPIVVERTGVVPRPPDDLAHLHFGDRIAYLLPAMG